jgi:hypothetical protein
MWAPAASAVTGPSHDDGVVNISHDQVPVQACNDGIPVGTVRAVTALNDVAGAIGALRSGKTDVSKDASCNQSSMQVSDPTKPERTKDAGTKEMAYGTKSKESDPARKSASPYYGDGGVVNISHDQVPIQACNDTLGAAKAFAAISAALSMPSPEDVLVSKASSCHQGSAQYGG